MERLLMSQPLGRHEKVIGSARKLTVESDRLNLPLHPQNKHYKVYQKTNQLIPRCSDLNEANFSIRTSVKVLNQTKEHQFRWLLRSSTNWRKMII